MDRATGISAVLHSAGKFGKRGGAAEPKVEIRKILLSYNTRPTPERIHALADFGNAAIDRNAMDQAFSASESVTIPSNPLDSGFDPACPRLDLDTVQSALENNPDNRRWLARALTRKAEQLGLNLCEDFLKAADQLLSYLLQEASFWEADAFPLDAMAELPNRYGWTFSTDAWSLREQLRREAGVIRRAWRDLRMLAEEDPLLVILNESAPTDYMICSMPLGAAIWNGRPEPEGPPVLLYTGLKIASSEHRAPLAGTPEGDGLEQAVAVARELYRRPVLLDFSRRRFPRAFLRVCRFARQAGWRIRPFGKVRGRTREKLPGPKSPRGLPPLSGDPVLHLYDPWPISDPEIVRNLDHQTRSAFCKSPPTKPWQDDRIGARTELEADADGVYRTVSDPWVVPALGGWARTDDLFKSRLARFLCFDPS